MSVDTEGAMGVWKSSEEKEYAQAFFHIMI